MAFGVSLASPYVLGLRLLLGRKSWGLVVGEGCVGFFVRNEAVFMGSSLECAGRFAYVVRVVSAAIHVVYHTSFVHIVDWILGFRA